MALDYNYPYSSPTTQEFGEAIVGAINTPAGAAAVGATTQEWLSLISGTDVANEVATPLYLSKGGAYVIPQMFGGKDDAVIYPTAGSIAAGGNVVTFLNPHGLTAADIGKILTIDECGATAKDLWTTLTADGDGAGHHVTLNKPATRTVNAQNGVFYTADLAVGTFRSATMSMVAGSAVLTDSAGSYVAGDAGREIVVEQAINARLVGAITGVPTSTTVTINTTATVAGTGKTVLVGSDNRTVVASALAAATLLGIPLYFPKTRTGLYHVNLEGVGGFIWDNVACSIGRDTGVRLVVNCPYTTAMVGFRVTSGNNLTFDIEGYDPFMEGSMIGVGTPSRTAGLQLLYLFPSAAPIRNPTVRVKTIGCYAACYVAGLSTYDVYNLTVDIHAEWAGYGLVAQGGQGIRGKIYGRRFQRVLYLNAYNRISNVDLDVTFEQSRAGDGFVSLNLDLPNTFDMVNVKVRATCKDATSGSMFALRSYSDNPVTHRDIELHAVVPAGVTKPSLLIMMQANGALTGVYTTAGAPNEHRLEGVRTHGLISTSLFGYSKYPTIIVQNPEDIAEARINTLMDLSADGQVWIADPSGDIWSWGSSNSTSNRNIWKFPGRALNGFLSPARIEARFVTVIGTLAGPDRLNTRHALEFYRSGAGTSAGVGTVVDEEFFSFVNTNNGAVKPTITFAYNLSYVLSMTVLAWNHTSTTRAFVIFRPLGYGARSP